MAGGIEPWPDVSLPQAKTIGAYRNIAQLGPTIPDNASTDVSAGGSASTSGPFTTLSTDATAGEYAAVRVSAGPRNYQSGLVVVYLVMRVNQVQANLDETIEFGLIQPGTADTNDLVAFRPNVGDATAGNVRVDASGVDSDGSFTYPDLNDTTHLYAIEVDYDASETRFYVDKNPLADTADTTVSATPDLVREVGAQIVSATTDATEQVLASAAGAIFIP